MPHNLSRGAMTCVTTNKHISGGGGVVGPLVDTTMTIILNTLFLTLPGFRENNLIRLKKI